MAKPIVVSDGVTKTVLSQGNGPDIEKGREITVHCTGKLPAEYFRTFWGFVSLGSA